MIYEDPVRGLRNVLQLCASFSGVDKVHLRKTYVHARIPKSSEMKTMLPCLLLVMMPAFVSCEKEVDGQPSEKKITVTKTTAEVIASDNVFGLELFQKVAGNGGSSENIFISPTSVALALAMTYNGSDGGTMTAMENTLGKNGLTLEEINGSYKSLIDALVSADPDVLLEIANSIWYRQGFSVLPEFVDANQEYYDAEVSDLDFNLPGAPDVINTWVDEKTHGRITEIIQQIPAETVMYLINAIYFKGTWLYEFDEELTADDQFYAAGNSVTVPFMVQEAGVGYAANDDFSMIELPYGQGNFSMVVMLPNEGHATDDILPLLTSENWDQWLDAMTTQDVMIKLPKFKFEYKNQLNDELSDMGMGVAFTDMADFTKINPAGNLFISKVLHKSFIEVNEEGTEAAAVTSVEISLTSFPGTQPLQFVADHPFVFAIREKDTGAILFMGLMQDPSS